MITLGDAVAALVLGALAFAAIFALGWVTGWLIVQATGGFPI